MNRDWNVDPDRIFTLDELADTYPHQWLAVNVVERDSATEQPVRVTVLKRGVDAYTVRDITGTQSFCTLFTGPIPEITYVGMF